MLKRYERCYKKDYESLAGHYVKEIFDIDEDNRGTWFTARFTNEEIHLVLLPNVHTWDEERERIFKEYPVKENAVGFRVADDDNQNRYFVMQIWHWNVWFLFERKIKE